MTDSATVGEKVEARHSSISDDIRWRIVLHPSVLGTQQWSLWSGLAAFARAGVAHVSYSGLRHEPAADGLLMRVTDVRTHITRLIAMEMTDLSAIDSWNAEHATLIFKRSFDPSLHRAGSYAGTRAAVRPMGLTFTCTAPGVIKLAASSNATLTRALVSRDSRLPIRYLAACWKAVGEALWVETTGRAAEKVPEKLSYYESFQRDVRERPYVTYLVKAWDPTGSADQRASDRDTTTSQRAQLIRRLRDDLGERFCGGFVPTEYACRNYPDCVARVPTGRREFVARFVRGGIAISTHGLWGSNPWKLAEYLATGTVIVSEPLLRTIPEPLVEDQTILTFDSPDACVEKCRSLLDDEDHLSFMRDQSIDYWNRYVRPDQLLSNRLVEALSP